jgi:hypothetical protein
MRMVQLLRLLRLRFATSQLTVVMGPCRAYWAPQLRDRERVQLQI